jgi:hypothetical protein
MFFAVFFLGASNLICGLRSNDNNGEGHLLEAGTPFFDNGKDGKTLPPSHMLT